MSVAEFRSVFATEMLQYLKSMEATGYKQVSYRYKLILFDRFCVEHEIHEPIFSHEHASEWLKRRQNEASTTHYSRINAIKQFLMYLKRLDYNVIVTEDIAFIQTDFQPHIYSDSEITRYFHAVDTYESARNRKDAIQFPVLFRILYCCGTRINETLGIRKQDVDLENGIIKLFEAKNNCERYIVLGNDLLTIVKRFAEKCFYLLQDGEYIFTTSNGGRLGGDDIYEMHRMFLQKAGIPYV